LQSAGLHLPMPFQTKIRMGNLERETRIGTALPEKVPSSCRTESIGESENLTRCNRRGSDWRIDLARFLLPSCALRKHPILHFCRNTSVCWGESRQNCDILYTKIVHPIELTERLTRALPETAQFIVPALPRAFARAAHFGKPQTGSRSSMLKCSAV
jgi:hypothetical protein